MGHWRRAALREVSSPLRAGSKPMNRTQCRDIMSSPAVCVPQDADLARVARLMLDHDIGAVLVTDAAGKLVGIVTDGDFAGREVSIPFSAFRLPSVFGKWLGGEDSIEAIYAHARVHTAAEVMSSPVHAVNEDDFIEAAIGLMLEHDIKHLAVVRDGVPVGMVARHDLLKLMFARLHP